MVDLKGKSVLITGAAKRIGREIALTLGRAGANVAITFRTSEPEARQTVQQLGDLGVEAFSMRCDVSDELDVKEVIAEVTANFGDLDILVNNAGAYQTVDFEAITVSEWDEVFATNVKGVFLMSQAAVPPLRKSKGRIINVGSLGGLRPWAHHAHYCASKAALHMLTQVAAKALAPEISVNCVAPGMIDQGESAGNKELQRVARKTPMQRNGSAADVAKAVMFFASGPHFVTGQVLAVDGGLGLQTV